MARERYFSPELLAFLRQLKRNNKREWFTANKERFEQFAREPLLRFIADFAPRLKKISPHFVADARPTGGSLFRIYRDTRFSRDKSPYKTWVAMRFGHEKAKDVHAPGFYLHIAPDSVFVGVGIWHPDSAGLARIRDAIVASPPAWKRAISDKAFRSRFELAGDSLKRPPKGYDPDHPLIEDLKRKDFIASSEFEPKAIARANFMDRFETTARAARSFMRFLTKAVGLAW